MSRRRVVLLVSMLSVLALGLTATGSAAAAQRIDMKVLLLGTSSTEPDFVSWQAALQREGVPYEAIITSPGHTPITAATLSDTLAGGTMEGKYQAIIVSVGGLPECTSSGCTSTLSTAEWTALEEYEHTFSVRQLTGDVFPGSTYGLNSPTTSGALDGTVGELTATGKSVFPYLNGPVKMDTGTYGYQATPLAAQAAGASFQTLVEGPGGSALVGIYTHSSGVQEMVEAFNENQYQLQAELLRHGVLNWVTRGIYFGDQRNYVEMDIDDTFTPDDAWDVATHSIDYNDADALRMQPADVDYAAKWSEEHHFRMEQLFNGGGSVEYQEDHTGTDPLLAEFQKTNPATGKSYAASFGWLSHTYDTPYLDVGCATQNYIEAELNENSNWAAAAPGATPGTGGLGLLETAEPTNALGTENPHVFVPGNHSGFADLVPGNPATVDPPDLNPSTVQSGGGTLGAGSYQYAVTDQFTDSPTAGQSQAFVTEPLSVPAGGSVKLEWEAICHASDYLIYREPAESNKWSLIGTVETPQSATLPDNNSGEPTSTSNVSGGGELQQTFTDNGGAGTTEPPGWVPPTTEGAIESPWEQNPYFIPALEAVGITDVGADASKAYPDPPEQLFGIGTVYTGAEYAAGETFVDGTAQVVPRHPINIYYNVSTEAQEVDEYNTLYLPPSLGGECVASSTTTCLTTPANFAEVVNSVVSGMFQNMMNNDPRPSYVHQTNLMGEPPPGPATTGTPPNTPDKSGDGLLYSVLNPLLAEYSEFFTPSAPFEQLTLGAIGNLLAKQAAWNSAVANGQVSGYIENNQVTIQNSGAGSISVPLTGVTTVGSLYGGIQSGWTAPIASSTLTAPTTWPSPPTVTTNPVSKSAMAGETVTFSAGASGVPTPTVQWQLSTNGGVSFTNDVTDAGNATGTLTVAKVTATESGYEYRAVFTNSVSSATSAAATLTVSAGEAPKITTNPVSKTITVGEGTTFTATASGVPTPTVQWQVSTNGGVSFINDTTDAGNTTGTLIVASTTAAQNGQEYRAVFTNTVSSATSTAATLSLNMKTEAPRITTNPASKTVTAGENATFTAAASGLPGPTVQWQVSINGGVSFTNDASDAGNTGSTLTVASATTAQSGREYRAVFTNSVGSATSTPAALIVNPKTEAPKITTNPASKTVTAGENATFTAAASGLPAPTVQWQVSTNGGLTFTKDTTDAGNTTGTLTVAGTTAALSGREYRAVFTNSVGSATSVAATLTVKAPPAPVVSGVLPGFGFPGLIVEITGKNFTNVLAVNFGLQPTVGIVESSTQMFVIAPLDFGTVNVTVRTTSGVSAISSADQFSYGR